MLIPFFLCFIFTLLREMIKDMEDYDGDLYSNSYTAPIFFGKRKMNLYIIIYTNSNQTTHIETTSVTKATSCRLRWVIFVYIII